VARTHLATTVELVCGVHTGKLGDDGSNSMPKPLTGWLTSRQSCRARTLADAALADVVTGVGQPGAGPATLTLRGKRIPSIQFPGPAP